MNCLNLIQININLSLAKNDSQWNEIRQNYKQITDALISKLFLDGVKAQVYYLESHQLNINLLGSFTPENEDDLILKYNNDHDFLTNEVPRLVQEVLKNYQYQLELGRMNFISLASTNE